MEEVKELTKFFSAIRDDPRIGKSHISIFMALFQFYNLNGFENPIHFRRADLMAASKISGLATYHKCIKELVEFGYILYLPSFKPAVLNRIYLV